MTWPRSRTRIKTLAYETVLANQQHFIPVEWKDDAEVLCLDVPMDAILIRCPDVSLSLSVCFLGPHLDAPRTEVIFGTTSREQ